MPRLLLRSGYAIRQPFMVARAGGRARIGFGLVFGRRWRIATTRPTALLVILVGLGSAGLLVGLVSGRQGGGRWFMPALALLSGFYVGTWLNSPHHSFAGDPVVMALATVPACVSAALGSAVGPHLATRQRERKTRNDLPEEAM
ncbi:hypothetical protein O7622_18345 [Micromonospora sp. WMMD1076]|uniref:hypothetical protein n=1 Tax=Micromonospora sp. WMMD1076 TaxID=3016103 RepID=UPI00249C6CE9|nr:hypothetical protein [Micromonospora sp. WMMD1076]WFF05022.1 hypothetical protein O7622_18345 [Micromonospora sp. WMMD1076]